MAYYDLTFTPKKDGLLSKKKGKEVAEEDDMASTLEVSNEEG